ncbi:hypothetical protein P5V15_008894 [Pogonomyrmex californicus]
MVIDRKNDETMRGEDEEIVVSDTGMSVDGSSLDTSWPIGAVTRTERERQDEEYRARKLCFPRLLPLFSFSLSRSLSFYLYLAFLVPLATRRLPVSAVDVPGVVLPLTALPPSP